MLKNHINRTNSLGVHLRLYFKGDEVSSFKKIGEILIRGAGEIKSLVLNLNLNRNI